MSYVAFNNGLSLRAVDPNYQVQSGETLFSAIPTTQQLTNAFTGYAAAAANFALQNQIAALEATQTPSRMRAAILGTDGGWLESLNSQITTLQSRVTEAQIAQEEGL